MKSDKPLKDILTDYLIDHRPNFVHGGELERVGQANGYEAETARRRLRELTNKAHPNYNYHIEKTLINKCIAYRYKDDDNRVRIIDKVVKTIQGALPIKLPQVYGEH